MKKSCMSIKKTALNANFLTAIMNMLEKATGITDSAAKILF